jgi:hypothetical protein
MLLWGVLFSLLSSLHAQDFTTNLDFGAVTALFNDNKTCIGPAASKLCRHLPWVPRLHEGVVEKDSAVFIFMDEDLPSDTQIARWSKKFAASSRAEMVAYFLVNNPGLAKSLANSPYTVAYLVMLRKVGESYRIVSVSMNVTGQITAEVESQYNLVQGEIEETRAEWIPPLNFKMGHQFKLNDTL